MAQCRLWKVDSDKNGSQRDLSALSLNLIVAGPHPGTKPTVQLNETHSISLKQRPQRGAVQSPKSYATSYKDQFTGAQIGGKGEWVSVDNMGLGCALIFPGQMACLVASMIQKWLVPAFASFFCLINLM